MKFFTQAALGATVLATTTLAQAQNQSVCDKYTTALFKENTAKNQYTLLVKLVNTALIGNYTPGAKNHVNGILVPGEQNGTAVNLLPYFNGGFVSTNTGRRAASVNFIDDGGATALAADLPATGTSSKQYTLVTHLYQFFGALLGCSEYGTTDFPSYGGSIKMYEVHKYMNTDVNELTYFITQVALAATSFGVSTEDVTSVGMALSGLFGQRCAPAVTVLPSQPADLQAICINSDCPQASAPACSLYNKRAGGVGVQPVTATSTPGPQSTALAAQLSAIQTSVASASAMQYTASVITTNISGSTVVRTTSVPIAAGGAAEFTTSTGTTTGTKSSSIFTSTFTTSGSISDIVTSVPSTVTTGSSTFTTSVAETIESIVPLTVAAVTSVVTSGSVTMTTVFSTTKVVTGAAGGAAATTTSKAAGVPLKVQGGLLAVAGVAAAYMV